MALDFDKVNSYSRGLKEKTQPRDNTRINSKLEPRKKKRSFQIIGLIYLKLLLKILEKQIILIIH